MEYDGRILAVNSNKVDSDGNYIEKTENRGWNNVSTTVNSPGSSIKPIGVYAPAIENKYITYGSYYSIDQSTKRNAPSITFALLGCRQVVADFESFHLDWA